MRVQGLSFSGLSNIYNSRKPGQTKNMSNPPFKGQVYDITYLSGCTGLGPGCTIYDKDGKILTQSHSGMYERLVHGVQYAVDKIAPGKMEVTETKYLGCDDKGLLYLADPEETITDEMRAKYNYIATERPPHIPKLSAFDHKFHTLSEDNTDFNKELGVIKDYYSRMLLADTKEKAKYEILKIEHEINFKKARNYKNKLYLRTDDTLYISSDRLKEEKDKQDYFIDINWKALKDDDEKIAYYNYKNELTQRKIDFLENIAKIMNRTGDAFIRRDILARKRKEHINDYQTNIRKHIDIMTQIRLTEAEKEHLEKQILVMNKKHKALTNQSEKGNKDPFYFGYNSTGVIKSEKHIHTYYEEQQEAKAQLTEYDNKLKELTQKRHELQKRIHNDKVKIKEYSDQIKPILDSIEPIYQELKTYYEENCPFSQKEFSVY